MARRRSLPHRAQAAAAAADAEYVISLQRAHSKIAMFSPRRLTSRLRAARARSLIVHDEPVARGVLGHDARFDELQQVVRAAGLRPDSGAPVTAEWLPADLRAGDSAVDVEVSHRHPPLDLLDHKLQAARDFGATHTINAANENDPAATVQTLTGGRGVDYAFVTVGSPVAVAQALTLIRRGGALPLRGDRTMTARPLDASSRGAPTYVWRFTPLQRTLHALVIVSFIGLVLTGLPLRFAYAPWARPVVLAFGGLEAAGVIHRLCAIITFGYFFTHVATVIARIARGAGWKRMLWGPESLVPQPKDVRDVIRMFKWFFGRGPRPQFDRFSYMEKFDYLGVFWGVAIIGTSGLILWFPEFFGKFLPGWVFNVAAIVHGDEALLAMSFIFTIHFFNVHLRPEKFPIDLVIFTGRHTVDYMKEEHPLEYERYTRTPQEEERTPTAPDLHPAVGDVPRREQRLARLGGLFGLVEGRLAGRLGRAEFLLSGVIDDPGPRALLDLKARGSQVELGELLDYLAAADAKAVHGIKGGGRLDFDLSIRGLPGPRLLSGIEGTVRIANASFRYPGAPAGIEALGFTARFARDTVTIGDLRARVAGQPVRASLFAARFADPWVRFAVQGDLNLAAITPLVAPKDAKLEGRAAVDVRGSGRARDPGALALAGSAKLVDVSVQSPALPNRVEGVRADIRFTPERASLDGSLRVRSGLTTSQDWPSSTERNTRLPATHNSRGSQRE